MTETDEGLRRITEDPAANEYELNSSRAVLTMALLRQCVIHSERGLTETARILLEDVLTIGGHNETLLREAEQKLSRAIAFKAVSELSDLEEE